MMKYKNYVKGLGERSYDGLYKEL